MGTRYWFTKQNKTPKVVSTCREDSKMGHRVLVRQRSRDGDIAYCEAKWPSKDSAVGRGNSMCKGPVARRNKMPGGFSMTRT